MYVQTGVMFLNIFDKFKFYINSFIESTFFKNTSKLN